MKVILLSVISADMFSSFQALKEWLILFGILTFGVSAIVFEEADATVGCDIFDLDRTWLSVDNIYTGKIVAVTYQTDHVQNGTDAEDMNPKHDVIIDFELEHILKGYPQYTSWEYHVPEKTYCPGSFHCNRGADHYTLGSEVFYISSNEFGQTRGGSCGIGTMKVDDGDYWTLPDEFFDHFEKIYGFEPPRDMPCPDADHVLVLLDGRNLACVDPLTAEEKNWDAFDIREYQSNPSEWIFYDYPVSSKRTTVINKAIVSDAEIIVSNLPKVGETAEVTMRYTHLHEYSEITPDDLKRISISSNFEFVGIDEEKIDVHAYGKRISHYTYSEAFAPLRQNQTDTMSVTIRAISEGSAFISGVGPNGGASYHVVVGEGQTLHVWDYIRTSNPMPDMSVILSPLQAAEFEAHADPIPSPLQQKRDGVPLTEIVCADDRVLMMTPSNSPICVFLDSMSVLEQRWFGVLSETSHN